MNVRKMLTVINFLAKNGVIDDVQKKEWVMLSQTGQKFIVDDIVNLPDSAAKMQALKMVDYERSVKNG